MPKTINKDFEKTWGRWRSFLASLDLTQTKASLLLGNSKKSISTAINLARSQGREFPPSLVRLMNFCEGIGLDPDKIGTPVWITLDKDYIEKRTLETNPETGETYTKEEIIQANLEKLRKFFGDTKRPVITVRPLDAYHKGTMLIQDHLDGNYS